MRVLNIILCLFFIGFTLWKVWRVSLSSFFIHIINIWNSPNNCESLFKKYECQKSSFYLHSSYISLFEKCWVSVYPFFILSIFEILQIIVNYFEKCECHYLHSLYVSSTFKILQIIVNHSLKSMSVKNYPISILHTYHFLKNVNVTVSILHQHLKFFK